MANRNRKEKKLPDRAPSSVQGGQAVTRVAAKKKPTVPVAPISNYEKLQLKRREKEEKAAAALAENASEGITDSATSRIMSVITGPVRHPVTQAVGRRAVERARVSLGRNQWLPRSPTPEIPQVSLSLRVLILAALTCQIFYCEQIVLTMPNHSPLNEATPVVARPIWCGHRARARVIGLRRKALLTSRINNGLSKQGNNKAVHGNSYMSRKDAKSTVNHSIPENNSAPISNDIPENHATYIINEGNPVTVSIEEGSNQACLPATPENYSTVNEGNPVTVSIEEGSTQMLLSDVKCKNGKDISASNQLNRVTSPLNIAEKSIVNTDLVKQKKADIKRVGNKATIIDKRNQFMEEVYAVRETLGQDGCLNTYSTMTECEQKAVWDRASNALTEHIPTSTVEIAPSFFESQLQTFKSIVQSTKDSHKTDNWLSFARKNRFNSKICDRLLTEVLKKTINIDLFRRETAVLPNSLYDKLLLEQYCNDDIENIINKIGNSELIFVLIRDIASRGRLRLNPTEVIDQVVQSRTRKAKESFNTVFFVGGDDLKSPREAIKNGATMIVVIMLEKSRIIENYFATYDAKCKNVMISFRKPVLNDDGEETSFFPGYLYVMLNWRFINGKEMSDFLRKVGNGDIPSLSYLVELCPQNPTVLCNVRKDSVPYRAIKNTANNLVTK